MEGYLNITVISEWICFFAALVLLDRKTRAWRLFIPWLLLILVAETTGWYIRTRLGIYDNALPFNLLMIISNLFLMWVFSIFPVLQPARNRLRSAMLAFFLISLLNLFFYQGLRTYNYYSETLADIILVIICCHLFYELVTGPAYVSLLRLDYFWLAIGVLFSALGSALLYQFGDALQAFFVETNIYIGTYINFGLNLILYTSLIIAFIWRRKTTR